MSSQPKKNRLEETPQHSWPAVRPNEPPGREGAGLWQRIRHFFSLFSAMGSRLPPATPENSMPNVEPVRLPASARDDSLFDDDDDEVMEKLAANNPGTLILFSSLNSVFCDRPFDDPLYTAGKGQALIAIYFSEKNLPHPETLERVASGGYPITLHLTAEPKWPSPVLRADLVVPDNHRLPLVFETLLDLRDEDVQDFLQAVVDSDELDLLLRHEENPETTFDLSVSAPRLPALVITQLAILANDPRRDAPPVELGAGRKTYSRVYRSSRYSLERDTGVKLRRVGPARCLLREERRLS